MIKRAIAAILSGAPLVAVSILRDLEKTPVQDDKPPLQPYDPVDDPEFLDFLESYQPSSRKGD